MRVLVPLPFDLACHAHGRNLRVINLLAHLNGQAEITLAVADREVAETASAALPLVNVKLAPDIPATGHIRPATCSPWWLRRAAEFFGYDPALHASVGRLSQDADVVLGFDVLSAPYLTGLGGSATKRAACVCDLIDDPWLTFRSGRLDEQFSLCGAKTALAVRTLRQVLLPRLDMLLAVAPNDAAHLSRSTGRAVRVVPNGVRVPDPMPERNEREALVVFTGAMSFPPNEQAAHYLVRAIWPRVRRMVPGARLALVGADPSPMLQKLGEEHGVTVTGRVPDIAVWLRRARAAAAPMLSGTGLKNKILEACAQACPVVATSHAVGGIPAGPEHGILLADDPVAFASHLVHLLTDAAASRRIGQAGRSMVSDRFSWPGAARTLWAALCECVTASACTHRKAQSQSASPDPSQKEVVAHAAT